MPATTSATRSIRQVDPVLADLLSDEWKVKWWAALPKPIQDKLVEKFPERYPLTLEKLKGEALQ